MAAAVVLFLPTVVLNSSLWGQIDATYASLGLGGLYFVLRRRPWLACTFFGLALSFKLQVVFLFPVLLLLVLRRWVPWRTLVMVPALFVLVDVPALVAGASISTLWSTYAGEIGLYQELTLNAPSVYQYLGTSESTVWRDVGLAVTLAVVLALIAVIVVGGIELTITRTILAGTVAVLLVPYFLPAMHERYFYLADALTVISVFYVPRRLWPLPVLEQFASLLSYMPFLLATTTTGGGARASTGASGRQRAAATGGGPPGSFPGNGPGPGGGSTLPPGASGALSRGQGGIGLAGHTVVSFKILSTVMLAALVLALWATIREFGRGGDPAAAAERPDSRGGVLLTNRVPPTPRSGAALARWSCRHRDPVGRVSRPEEERTVSGRSS